MSVLKPSDNAIGFIVQTIENAMCDEDETLDERLAIIEDVLCELDEKINGGE